MFTKYVLDTFSLSNDPYAASGNEVRSARESVSFAAPAQFLASPRGREARGGFGSADILRPTFIEPR